MATKKLNTEAKARIEAEHIDRRPFTAAVSTMDAREKFKSRARTARPEFTLGEHTVKLVWELCDEGVDDTTGFPTVTYCFEDDRGDSYGKFSKTYMPDASRDRYGKNDFEWFLYNIGKQMNDTGISEAEFLEYADGGKFKAWYMERRNPKTGNYYKFWQFNDPDAKDNRKHQVEEEK